MSVSAIFPRLRAPTVLRQMAFATPRLFPQAAVGTSVIVRAGSVLGTRLKESSGLDPAQTITDGPSALINMLAAFPVPIPSLVLPKARGEELGRGKPQLTTRLQRLNASGLLD